MVTVPHNMFKNYERNLTLSVNFCSELKYGVVTRNLVHKMGAQCKVDAKIIEHIISNR